MSRSSELQRARPAYLFCFGCRYRDLNPGLAGLGESFGLPVDPLLAALARAIEKIGSYWMLREIANLERSRQML